MAVISYLRDPQPPLLVWMSYFNLRHLTPLYHVIYLNHLRPFVSPVPIFACMCSKVQIRLPLLICPCLSFSRPIFLQNLKQVACVLSVFNIQFLFFHFYFFKFSCFMKSFQRHFHITSLNDVHDDVFLLTFCKCFFSLNFWNELTVCNIFINAI